MFPSCIKLGNCTTPLLLHNASANNVCRRVWTMRENVWYANRNGNARLGVRDEGEIEQISTKIRSCWKRCAFHGTGVDWCRRRRRGNMNISLRLGLCKALPHFDNARRYSCTTHINWKKDAVCVCACVWTVCRSFELARAKIGRLPPQRCKKMKKNSFNSSCFLQRF